MNDASWPRAGGDPNAAGVCACVHPCASRGGVTLRRPHLQGEVVLQAGGDVQQRGTGLTRAEHELYVPGDGGRRRCQVVPLQQTATQEALRAGHHYRKKKM